MASNEHMDKASPRVAILSPYHSRAEVVECTFRSIAAQTFQDFEALIWDDCSPDGTWEEMQRVLAELNDPRFTIYRHETNLGLTQGLNQALQRTSAEFIAIVGSGDECHPERIERQVAALTANPDAVFCATASTTADPVSGKTFFDSRYDRDIIELEDIQHVCPFTHGSVMYRASALAAIGRYETAFKWCADWDVFFRLLRTGPAIYIKDILYFRTAQVDGVSFAPRKAFEQIPCKHLALKLSRLDSFERKAVLDNVREKGIDAALASEMAGISRDLARRNVKLYLMGREEAADEMRSLAKQRRIDYPMRYRFFVQIAKWIGKLPVNPDFMIGFARILPK